MAIDVRIKNAFEASQLQVFGYTPHIQSSDGSMVTYSSLDREASVKLFINDRGEVEATLLVVHDRSMIQSSIKGLSFPNTNVVYMLNQLERLAYAWKHA